MNIQIFGTKKSSDTRKAERFFKERGIKFQFIDMKEKELSKGEFNSVMQAVGGVDAMIDPACKDKDLLALVTYISADERAEKVMENQSVLRQPIVRNGRMATVGYAPDVWKRDRDLQAVRVLRRILYHVSVCPEIPLNISRSVLFCDDEPAHNAEISPFRAQSKIADDREHESPYEIDEQVFHCVDEPYIQISAHRQHLSIDCNFLYIAYDNRNLHSPLVQHDAADG